MSLQTLLNDLETFLQQNPYCDIHVSNHQGKFQVQYTIKKKYEKTDNDQNDSGAQPNK
ncbi:hypothetical protein SAMN05192533_102308 [Mesobacillus persicus]|uniref:Uncharacterized protein n=1 Tax=Mesobacillus persicus TaxID=930146 RepID=A0A1H7XRH6_9BACI|nr:hypothetical protein [Mesobacillus persicus]SEM35778.1 hypothetical protein SAMN05192533_102308 [Mesobacillus persicus]